RLQIYGEGGNDTITVTNAFQTLDGISSVSVDGGPGCNTLQVDDSGYCGGGDTYAITDTQVCLPSRGGLIASYTNIQQLDLTTGCGGDTINIGTLSGGISSTQFPQIDVDGGGGANTLNIIDQNGSAGALYTVDSFGAGQGDVSVGSLPNLMVAFQ